MLTPATGATPSYQPTPKSQWPGATPRTPKSSGQSTSGEFALINYSPQKVMYVNGKIWDPVQKAFIVFFSNTVVLKDISVIVSYIPRNGSVSNMLNTKFGEGLDSHHRDMSVCVLSHL